MKSGVAACLIIAAVLILIGAIVVFMSGIALLDPVGTKHADDGDPFGTPPSWIESTIILLLGCGFLVVAALLIRSAIKRARAT